MLKLIKNPSTISAEGNKPRRVHECIGRVNTETGNVSIAHMISPAGWTELRKAEGQNILSCVSRLSRLNQCIVNSYTQWFNLLDAGSSSPLK